MSADLLPFTGHIYVVGFADLVKVGRTQHPERRVATHARMGRAFQRDGDIRVWTSARHYHYGRNERHLIDWCRSQDDVAGEYFRLPFDDVVDFAQTLNFGPMTDAEVAEVRETQSRQGALMDALFPSASSAPSYEVPEPTPEGFWSAAHDDEADGDRRVYLDSSMGLPVMNLWLEDCDGLASPAAARALALQLLYAANYAEQCHLTKGASA